MLARKEMSIQLQKDAYCPPSMLRYGLAVVLLSLVSSTTFAESAPDSIYGNYVGMGKCLPNTPKPCTDTGEMDTIYIQPLDKNETEEERQIREGYGLEKHDIRVSIRILGKHGHNCTFKQDMFWVKDRLKFFPKAPYAEKICKLEIMHHNDTLALKDLNDACGCDLDMHVNLNGRQYKKGLDPLVEAYNNPSTPPPAEIFGKYIGTGECAKDERKSGLCDPEYNAAKNSDYIEIIPSKTADARVVFGSTRGKNDDFYCLRDVSAIWLGDHLFFYKATTNNPGTPHILQFWFKEDTVVASNIWSEHCGTYVHSSLFKKVTKPLATQD